MGWGQVERNPLFLKDLRKMFRESATSHPDAEYPIGSSPE